jgi:hypothetical protein
LDLRLSAGSLILLIEQHVVFANIAEQRWEELGWLVAFEESLCQKSLWTKNDPASIA